MAMSARGRSDILPMKHSEYAAQLFQTSLFSDCTIYSNHRVWHLHRCILSPRSEFFWSCLQGDFEEASTSMIEMHDDDPRILDRMLRWMYTMELPEQQAGSKDETFWTDHLQLYLMADKYNLTELMNATRETLLFHAVACGEKPDLLTETTEDFVDAMEMLYKDVPDQEGLIGLRDSVVRHAAPAIAQNIRTSVLLQELMSSAPAFGVALVEQLAKRPGERRFSASSSFSGIISTGSCDSGSGGNSPQYSKPYIPLNEDSDEEFE